MEKATKRNKLWFAFVLTFRDICNSAGRHTCIPSGVVICFRSYISWYLQQYRDLDGDVLLRCDLLSFLHFVIFATVLTLLHVTGRPLWFAFVLTFRDICNSELVFDIIPGSVVICFRSYISWYLQQCWRWWTARMPSCDLLSFLHFVIFATVSREMPPNIVSCDLLSFLHFVIFATVIRSSNISFM